MASTAPADCCRGIFRRHHRVQLDVSQAAPAAGDYSCCMGAFPPAGSLGRWRLVMAIRAFLNGKSFDPTTIEIMAAAFRDVCADLGHSGKRDVAWEVVAKRVIEVMKVD